jgi:CHAD domain-containing protein
MCVARLNPLMAFRLKRTKPASRQVERIAARELRKAIDEVAIVSTRRAAVHAVRKQIKKLRAVLHLLHDELGGDYARLNGRLRSAARELSAVRDADVMVDVMKSLRRQYPDVLTDPVFAPADAVLSARRRAARERLTARHVAGVRDKLVRSREDIPSRLRRAATRRTLRDGVLRGYRRARRALEKAAEHSEDQAFHEWRRRVKDHWYQLRLVEDISPKVRNRARRLKRLQDSLGDEHNLVVLRTVILKQPRRFGDARIVASLLGCIEGHQEQLRTRAIRRGRQLFSRKASAFRKQISHAWH